MYIHIHSHALITYVDHIVFLFKQVVVLGVLLAKDKDKDKDKAVVVGSQALVATWEEQESHRNSSHR